MSETFCVTATVLLVAAVIQGTLALAGDNPALVILPLVLAVAAVAAIVLFRACQGRPVAIMLFLFVFVFVNDAAFRVREPGALGLDWQNGLKFMLWGGAALIGICQFSVGAGRMRGMPVACLVAFLLWALTSTLYSASPFYTLTTCFGLLAMLLFAGAAVARLTERQLLLTFCMSLWVFAVAGWGAYYAVPELGRSLFITAENTVVERMCGLAGQANSLGCDLASMLVLTHMMRDRKLVGYPMTLLLGGTGLFTLLAADSRTALLAAFFAIGVITLRRANWRMAVAVLGLIGLFLISRVTPPSVIAGLVGGLSRSGDPNELFTLTGRTEIWEYAWEQIVQQPWLGYGYNSSKFILPQFSGLPGLQVDEAHNMLLQNLLGTGIVGTAPLILMFISLLYMFARRPDARRDVFTFVNLIWGITVAGAYGSTPTVMSLATFCGLALASRRQPVAANAPLSLSNPAISPSQRLVYAP